MSEPGAVPRERVLERALAWIAGDPDVEAGAYLQALIDRGATEELEWALLEAGLAMERDLLEQRLADFERARGYRP